MTPSLLGEHRHRNRECPTNRGKCAGGWRLAAAFNSGKFVDAESGPSCQCIERQAAELPDDADGALATLNRAPDLIRQKNVLTASDSVLSLRCKPDRHAILGFFVASLSKEGVVVAASEYDQLFAGFGQDDLRSTHVHASSTINLAAVSNEEDRDVRGILLEDKVIVADAKPQCNGASHGLPVAASGGSISFELRLDLPAGFGWQLSERSSGRFGVVDSLHHHKIADAKAAENLRGGRELRLRSRFRP